LSSLAFEFDLFVLLACHFTKSFGIRTSKKRACKAFGMNTYRTLDLKLFGMNTYRKRGRGVPPKIALGSPADPKLILSEPAPTLIVLRLAQHRRPVRVYIQGPIQVMVTLSLDVTIAAARRPETVYFGATADHFAASKLKIGHSVSVVYGIATCP
jgi:hypothetical protein